MLDRRRGEASVLRDFEAVGELVICDRFGDDIAEIATLAGQIDGKGLLRAEALDLYGVGAIVDARMRWVSAVRTGLSASRKAGS